MLQTLDLDVIEQRARQARPGREDLGDRDGQSGDQPKGWS